ncbi:MAG: cob(I)yrinic acid a,c-diamide adenosyltransferase [Candidatus Harrisonbacteria bacterium CG10_big_fil_rev_8_21_14_0_10_49_15]|uniref:Cob(I)yrinic acid a,c-diamide adenosyltransferase n=1 Tax=Candidatus Harrisonbacteria bacterium CG10_big_fil_rev_8_21_14_0_10_49_15 TaxID=1974587 RepID=A0A2H0UKW1_9BACT|nr:MAG: cob(I)yrinic acid a,c-diamide adenosyltransferase [Candidatus Harrisonbacteria bacterium CG10_big_fil_rev_8_21_14_0_10_49_15]
MLVIFTGNGKGKTTAALGAAVRAVGRGQRVLMVQFIKGPWPSGEDEVQVTSSKSQVASGKGGSFILKKMGLGFVGILGDQLPREEHVKAAKNALAFVSAKIEEGRRKNEDEYDMFILDEVNVAVDLKLVSIKEVLAVAELVPDNKVMVLTGRGAPAELIERADLVTEMKEVKHPFNDGKMGKINVEF